MKYRLDDGRVKIMEPNQKSILLVDDDPDVRLSLKDLLLFHGYACQEASNGAVAIQLLGSTTFDLIITDYHMPEINGLLLLKLLRQDPYHTEIPVILMTGLYTPEFHERAIELGAYGVLEKPSSGEKMLSLIQQAVSRSSCTCVE